MQIPLEIRFHNLDRSDAIEAAVRERAQKLEQFAADIVSCRVTIEAPHKHHRQGKLYGVKVDLHLPGGELVVSREPDAHHAHEDVYVALRDAFDAARRRLQDYVRVRRAKVKTHEGPPEGTIVALDPEQGCGWIATPEGREIYFHRNSVIDADFNRLRTGLKVRFHEEAGEEGPRATTVHLIGKPDLAG